MTEHKYAPLGSVSHGTMRPEDLIPCFADVLEHLDRAAFDRFCLDWPGVEDPSPSEDDDECLEALFEALDALAPPYCYFGSHEGDGADYGFWICWDSLEEACADGEVLKVDAGDEWPELEPEVAYVLEVNDHGNACLKTRAGTVVWDVV